MSKLSQPFLKSSKQRKSLGRLLLIVLIGYILLSVLSYFWVQELPPYSLTSFFMAVSVLTTGVLFRFTSSSFLLMVFYSYPGFAVAYANAFGSSYIKPFNKFLLDDVSLLNFGALVFLSCILVSLFSHIYLLRVTGGFLSSSNIRTDYARLFESRGMFFIFCLSFVICALLAESGGTVLNQSYSALKNEGSSSSLASGLFAVFWVLAFLAFQRSSRTRVKVFFICTVIAVIWLLLHSKRAPVAGISFILLTYYGTVGKLTIRNLSIIFLLIVVLFLLGELRGTALLDYSLTSAISEVVGFDRDAVQLPGNGAGIYLSFLGSLYLTQDVIDFLYGSSYMRYVIGIIPDFVLSPFGIEGYRGFGHEIYAQHLPYVGGMHATSHAWVNFGLVGVVIQGLVFGYILSYILLAIENDIERQLPYAYLLIILAPAAMWYNLTIYLSWCLYTWILIKILIILTNVKR